MIEDENRRDDQNDSLNDARQDRYINMLRDMPPMSKMEPKSGKKGFLPPPPTVTRLGAGVQGCGGLLLALLSVPMVLVALWFGFYMWGPALFLVGGVVVLLATRGVWNGRRTPLVITLATLVVLAIVGYLWSTFVPAAAALSPLGSIGILFAPAIMLVALALAAALVLHIITLIYWKRLNPVIPRGLVVWGVGIAVVVVLALGFHFLQQSQRQSWLDERRDNWTTEAAADSMTLGANANITLGYSFVTAEVDDDPRFELRMAELEALLDADVETVRIGASGDMWLEEQEPRLFTSGEQEDDDDEDAPPTEEELAEAAERISRQQAYETDYMAHLQESGTDLHLSDSQYSPYLLVWSDKDGKIPWADFATLHEERIRRYAQEYQPVRYEVVTEPNAYAEYSGIDLPEDEAEQLELWVAHTEALRDAVHEASPETQVGVAIAIQDDFDLDYYERILALDGIDFISFRVYQPAAFDVIEDILAERGRPQDNGKELWLAETWYGYCLAPQRSMDLDSEWLEVVVAFALKESISGVMPSDYGCFLQEGGTLFADTVEVEGRTEVWETWRDLVETWRPS